MSDDWEPEQAALRDDETPDLSAHARRNIEQIRQFESDGVIDRERAEERIEAIKDSEANTTG